MRCPPPTYSLQRIGKPAGKGITEPSLCTLDAILKFDLPGIPHCVYSEIVALRLAEAIGAPVAAGGIVATDAGHAYASLQVGSPSLPLPDLLPQQYRKAASLYPGAVAALVAFDLWIGNWDRARNVKASLATPHIRVFRAFDHSHSLLGVDEDPIVSVARLDDMDIIVLNHPFYGVVREDLFLESVEEIAALRDRRVDEACVFGQAFRGVDDQLQDELSGALKVRRDNLKWLVTKPAFKKRIVAPF